MDTDGNLSQIGTTTGELNKDMYSRNRLLPPMDTRKVKPETSYYNMLIQDDVWFDMAIPSLFTDSRVCSDFTEETSSSEVCEIVELNNSIKHVDLAVVEERQPLTGNSLDVTQSNLMSMEHSSANKYEELELSPTDFFDHYDCSGESLKMDQPCGGSSNMDEWQPLTPKQKCILDPKQKQALEQILMQCEYNDLLRPFRTWEEKVVIILHVVRQREFTDYDPKAGFFLPYRFSLYNIAFFDFDKESEVVHGPKFRDISPYNYDELEFSFNVISIKVVESDVRYPLSIYGTILARDHNDYRCVYLFKRGRDNPQVITRKNRMLALTGPCRALGGKGSIYFEFDLKMKGEEAVDEDFSKRLKVLNVFKHTPGRPCTSSVESFLSTLDMVCVPVQWVLEASIGVKFLNGKSTFTGKIFSSTSGSYANTKMVMYDSQVAGTKTEIGSDGSVYLSRHIVAVPMGEDLLLYFVVCDSYNKSRHLKFVISQDVDERSCNLGTYRLHVKIIWKGVFRQHRIQLKDIGDTEVLW